MSCRDGLEDPQTQEGGALPLFPQALTEPVRDWRQVS